MSKEVKFCKKFYTDGTTEWFDKKGNLIDMDNTSLKNAFTIIEHLYDNVHNDLFPDFDEVCRVDSNPDGEIIKYDKDKNILYHQYTDGFIEEFEYKNNNIEYYSNSDGVKWTNFYKNIPTYEIKFDRKNKLLFTDRLNQLYEEYHYNEEGKLIYYKNNFLDNNTVLLYNDKVDKELLFVVKKATIETEEIYKNICKSNINPDTINISSICEQIFTNILYSLIDKDKYDKDTIEFYAIRFGGFKLSE